MRLFVLLSVMGLVGCVRDPAPAGPTVVAASQKSSGEPCKTIDDCAATTQSDKCCDRCEARAVSRQHAAALYAQCAKGTHDCPQLDCERDPNEVACVAGACVMVPRTSR